MNKKKSGFISKLFISAIFTAFFLTPIYSVQAEDVTMPEGVSMQCLAAKKKKSGHKVSLSTKPDKLFLPADSTVYIVECFSTKDGKSTCTTGRTEADQFLGLAGPPPKWKITHNITQPVKSDTEGRLVGEPFEWESVGRPDADHTFWGFLLTKSIDLTSSNPVLKLGSWYPQNADTDCVSLRWDPTGIVFDSKSLEPIPDIPVYLSDQNGKLVNQMGVQNPLDTDINGIFSFIVEEGYYSLKPVLSTHTFPSRGSISFVNDPAFPYINIYKGGNFFEPAGIVIEENIPVDPKSVPFRRPAEITDWAVELVKIRNTYKIHGGTAHPFSQITVKYNGAVIGSTTASKTGRFELYADGSQIENSFQIELAVEKPEIMRRTESLGGIFKAVYAQDISAGYKLEPILNYIEGYINDPSTNKPLANAKVSIYMIVSSKPFYETKTDNKGYVKIASQYLPPMQYYIKVRTATGNDFTLTTSQFVNKNQDYQKENNTDYGEFKPEKNLEALSTGSALMTESPPDYNIPSAIPTVPSRSNLISGFFKDTGGKYKKSSILIFIVLLVVSAGAISGAVYFLKKKQREKNEQIPSEETI